MKRWCTVEVVDDLYQVGWVLGTSDPRWAGRAALVRTRLILNCAGAALGIRLEDCGLKTKGGI